MRLPNILVLSGRALACSLLSLSPKTPVSPSYIAWVISTGGLRPRSRRARLHTARPVQPKERVSVCVARTLNAAGQPGSL